MARKNVPNFLPALVPPLRAGGEIYESPTGFFRNADQSFYEARRKLRLTGDAGITDTREKERSDKLEKWNQASNPNLFDKSPPVLYLELSRHQKLERR